MKKLVLLSAALTLVAVSSVSAQDLTGRLKKIKDTGTLTLGYRDSSIPFSYLDDNQKSIGYSMDICYKIADAVKSHLKLPKLNIALSPVTSATRIPLIANGTVDLECGSTTNNIERQQQVSFAPTTFVTATRFVAKKSSKLNDLSDFKGKTVVSTAGTSNLKWLTEANGKENLGMQIIPAKDHADAFLMVDSGRAVAFFMDDILLYGLVANAKSPDQWMVSSKAYTVEPYGMIEPKDDPAFKKVVDDAVVALMKSGEVEKLYQKWFNSPIPPRNVNLKVPMSDALKKVIANPTDSGDPAAYR
ncbi:amino acid ABC transporter substrate-binding protein [Pigmentiphaga sp.]|uniref:amino acid ABC transporter substrate-binding protein n=1 Tax=Pigmentiphaga sp. TaxID=1977564 RepID=UPI00128B7BCF|nr:amino acid ABC transporter substrate-binding protein [Pigmentiphaga sp.]MPS30675.1 amino acid ABC transporter substrate-binding protein [Alcaligenaceae bacterium SAGV5]MPS50237.1 amino acid ABC transporter substrate-binding protein [Alcaligenaceae bacterium SAGV3]MPT55671.1 amino acid ABC transporter substrate-binding protein [Alcaligenaceae bacterium]